MEKILKDNGLRILLEPDDRAKTASVGIWISSGTRYENRDINGISHFIEHILFKGTRKRSSFEIAETMDSIGAQFNAFTTKEYTCFYFRALSSYLDTALDVLLDMITDPRLDDSDINTEKGVILEEIGMYEDSPEDLMTDALYAGIWNNSMIGANILGTSQTVSSMNSNILRQHIDKFYSPEKMVISASGKFDSNMLLEKIDSYLGNKKSANSSVLITPGEYSRTFTICKKDFEQVNLCIGFPGIKSSDPRKYAFSIFGAITGGSSSSRLFQRIREELGLAYSVSAASYAYLGEGVFAIDMGVNPEQEKEALAQAVSILKDLSENGVTQREFERVKRQLVTNVLMSSESWNARAAHNGRSELLENNVFTHEEIAQKIEDVKIEDVNKIASEFVDFSQASVVSVGKTLCNEDDYKKILMFS